jgi:hypothetical protein
MCLFNENLEVVHIAKERIHVDIVRHVVAQVCATRGIERLNPKALDAEVDKVVELFRDTYGIKRNR